MSMKEENRIREKFGSKDPFRVPEGYFESFTPELMNILPERPQAAASSRRSFLPKFMRYAAAAAVCGLVLGGSVYVSHRIYADNRLSEDVSTEMDEYLDYALVSNQEIAQYLTEVY